eukprot:m.6930 g.6930  ORF g.6930 m.6930 type:complete len:576 (+) comp3612_c0_seq1:388-2115(+)
MASLIDNSGNTEISVAEQKMRSNDYKMAAVMWKRALKYADQNDIPKQIKINQQLGICLRATGLVHLALEHHKKELEHAEKLDDGGLAATKAREHMRAASSTPGQSQKQRTPEARTGDSTGFNTKSSIKPVRLEFKKPAQRPDKNDDVNQLLSISLPSQRARVPTPKPPSTSTTESFFNSTPIEKHPKENSTHNLNNTSKGPTDTAPSKPLESPSILSPNHPIHKGEESWVLNSTYEELDQHQLRHANGWQTPRSPSPTVRWGIADSPASSIQSKKQYSSSPLQPGDNMAWSMLSISTGRSGRISCDLNGRRLGHISKELMDSLLREYILEELRLSGNSLTKLPAEIGNLKALTLLTLSGNELEALPSSLGNLRNLRKLYAPGNLLTSLPSSLSKLSLLSRLEVQANNLRDIPESFCNLSNLARLTLSDNQLTRLPSKIGKLRALVKLDISGNKFTKLPEGISELTNLQCLIAERNFIKEIPTRVFNFSSNLKVLWLGSNRLQEIPESIGKLRFLKSLRVAGNYLKTLPVSVNDLQSLEELRLWDASPDVDDGINRIEDLHQYSIKIQDLIDASMP